MNDESIGWALGVLALVFVLMEARLITRLEHEIDLLIDGDEEAMRLLKLKRKLDRDG